MPQWIHRFELKPGCWVFVPDSETVLRGHIIKKEIAAKWRTPYYYAHLRNGGHVTALKRHLGNTLFIRADIKQFYNRISQNRVTRELKLLFKDKDYTAVRSMACESTVATPNQTPKKFILPFGFVQSAIIASMCLYNSALGKYLNRLEGNGFKVSVYMDDIIISTSLPLEQAESVLIELDSKASRSRFDLNPDKTTGPTDSITVFNINLSHNKLRISEERLAEFGKELSETDNQYVIDGILGYVKTVSVDQAESLRKT